jgi:RES domain-containing protein
VPPLTPHPNADLIEGVFTRMLARGLDTRWAGTAYRSVTPRYASSADLVSGAGAKKYAGRWNPPPPQAFRAVYGASTPELAIAENLAQSRRFGIPDADAMPRVLRALEIRLVKAADLTDGLVRRRLHVTLADLAEEPWLDRNAAGREALTQAVGRVAFESGFDGLIVPSAQSRSGYVVVVFPDLLGPGGRCSTADRSEN